MTDLRADAAVPLHDAPDPWTGSEMPSVRDGPPFHMTEMIEAEPALAARVLRRLADDPGATKLSALVRDVAAGGGSVVVTGCGTSEHGALGVADILADGLRHAGLPSGPTSPLAVQALELALDPPAGGLVIGVSHEGGTWATNRALEAARAAGARTALVTVSDRSPGGSIADVVVATGEMDESWCHTIGYVSPLLAAAAVAGHLTGRGVDAGAASGLMAAGLEASAGVAEAIAARLADAARIIVIGSGADRTAGRELVLKIEEATWQPSSYRDLETMLHGHLPATDRTTGLVVILADRDERDARVSRTRELLDASGVIGIRSAAILAEGASSAIEASLTPAGRIAIPEAPDLSPSVAALLGTAIPLQVLTERLARARGTNPDPIRRDDAVYREASDRIG